MKDSHRGSPDVGSGVGAFGGTRPVILAIDDEKAVLFTLQAVLEKSGFRVLTALDGVAGLDTFRKSAPAIVLTDIIMPQQDGIGAIMQMRRERPATKIVAVSGGGRVGDSDFLTVALKLGADAAIHKPFDTGEFLTVLRPLLDRRPVVPAKVPAV